MSLDDPITLAEAADRIGIWWEGHNAEARKRLSKYILVALKEARRKEYRRADVLVEALRQIDRETKSASDVVALRLGSIARNALAEYKPLSAVNSGEESAARGSEEVKRA